MNNAQIAIVLRQTLENQALIMRAQMLILGALNQTPAMMTIAGELHGKRNDTEALIDSLAKGHGP